MNFYDTWQSKQKLNCLICMWVISRKYLYIVLVIFPRSSWVTWATYRKSFPQQTVSNEFILPNIHECLDNMHCQIILNKIDVTNNSLYFRISNGKGWAGHIQKAAWWLFSYCDGVYCISNAMWICISGSRIRQVISYKDDANL